MKKFSAKSRESGSRVSIRSEMLHVHCGKNFQCECELNPEYIFYHIFNPHGVQFTPKENYINNKTPDQSKRELKKKSHYR